MKSVIIVAALWLLLQSIRADQVIEPKSPPMLAGRGRYVCGQTSSARADQFMLDTETGRLWRFVVSGTNQDIVLQPVLYYSIAGATTSLVPFDADSEIKELRAVRDKASELRKQVEADMKARATESQTQSKP